MIDGERVFVGIVTCERPEYYRQVEAGVLSQLTGLATWKVAAHDGPKAASYPVGSEHLPLYRAGAWEQRRGVAAAKNLGRWGGYHSVARDGGLAALAGDSLVPRFPPSWGAWWLHSQGTDPWAAAGAVPGHSSQCP